MLTNAAYKSRSRPRHSWLYALPSGCLPRSVICRSGRYEHVETFKHDFFAATGLYRGPDGLAVLKLGRTNDFMTIPAAWIGALLTRHEVRIYKRLQGIRGVPRLIGTVGKHGFMHEFVPGHPLARDERVSDAFFEELSALLASLQQEYLAYVDLNKRENVLIGDDGRPYLIDFQIALHLPPVGWKRLRPIRWILWRFQQADRYHCLKHKRRLRPDLLTDQERAGADRLSFWIRLHRWLTRPLTNLRRRTLKRLSGAHTSDVAGSAAK